MTLKFNEDEYVPKMVGEMTSIFLEDFPSTLFLKVK